MSSILESVRLALQISDTYYDEELMELIAAALDDLGLAGVTGTDDPEALDPLTRQAVKTYVRMAFGSPSDYDRLRDSYMTQKAQLMNGTGHTDWGLDDVES